MQMETRIPQVKFIFREDGEFVTRNAVDMFQGKRVLVFSLPGAFTPTCSNFQLPEYDLRYDEFIAAGLDDIYCISVNDGFVMNAWAKELDVKNVKLIPDGNADFTRNMGMLVSKGNLGFGNRSWRYAAYIVDGVVELMLEEEGITHNHPGDPYEQSTPLNVYNRIKEHLGIQDEESE